MTDAGRPGELGIGDRVRAAGRDRVVIGVSGPVVRLADAGGQVVTVSVSGLLSAEDFAVLDARPRPGMPPVSVLDDVPGEAAQEALWWQRHIVEVLRGVPPDAEEGTVLRPEYDPAVFSLTRRERAKAAELTAAGHPVTCSASGGSRSPRVAAYSRSCSRADSSRSSGTGKGRVRYSSDLGEEHAPEALPGQVPHRVRQPVWRRDLTGEDPAELGGMRRRPGVQGPDKALVLPSASPDRA